jgi:Galactose oxidase, central domain
MVYSMRTRRALITALASGLIVAFACSDRGNDRDKRGGGAPVTNIGGGPPPAEVPNTPLPQARTEVAGALWGDRIAIAGGYTEDGQPSARVDVLEPSGEWRRGPDLPARYDHASLAVLDRRLWLVGGNADGAATREVFSLGPGEAAWRAEASLAEARAALATVAIPGGLLAIGGANESGVLATTEIYDPQGKEWQGGPDLAVPREHTAAAVVGDQVYAIAGRQLSLESNLTAVEVLTLPDGEWQRAPDLRFSRGGTAAAGLAGGPCVAGGEEPGGTIPSVECLFGERWEQVATLGQPRHGLAVVAVGERLHVLGGGPRPGLFVSDAHEVLGPFPQG